MSDEWRRVAVLRCGGHVPPKKNSRNLFVDGAGKIHNKPSKEYCAWEKVATVVLMSAWREAGNFRAVGSATTAVWLRVQIWHPRGRRPDALNVYQSVEDVLQSAGVLTDDKWIEHHDGSRLYPDDGRGPRCEVEVFVRP